MTKKESFEELETYWLKEVFNALIRYKKMPFPTFNSFFSGTNAIWKKKDKYPRRRFRSYAKLKEYSIWK
jgi:hypothetical protein